MRGVFGGPGEGFFGHGFWGLLGGLFGEAIFSIFQHVVVNVNDKLRPGAIWGAPGGGILVILRGCLGRPPGASRGSAEVKNLCIFWMDLRVFVWPDFFCFF